MIFIHKCLEERDGRDEDPSKGINATLGQHSSISMGRTRKAICKWRVRVEVDLKFKLPAFGFGAGGR